MTGARMPCIAEDGGGLAAAVCVEHSRVVPSVVTPPAQSRRGNPLS